MRAAVALGLIFLDLLGAVTPHDHGGSFGAHACAACVAAGAEEARAATPDVAPRRVVSVALDVAAPRSRPAGAPLGAVPGQSPPVA
ncbi:MAG: hypothetical protein ACJ79E_08090 [Anaeromyxobacteraceae bacterium]